MANISSYPTATAVSGDLILGTQLSATSVNKTRNFTAGSVTAAGLGYTSYTALLTQTGTAAPVATVLSNNLTATLTWARTGTGTYTLTASAATFTNNKTIVFFNNGDASPNTNKWTRTSDTVLTLTIGIDAALANGSFEVRIYA
tara:strand:- start:7315 stop:7746 length:432 start_codon:yes stop_codon:yes gene_type:complete